MIGLYAPEQVRDMDARAFARGVDSVALMDRAAGHLARGVLAAARERGLRPYGLRVGLVCGKGNNGGDGIAAARLLAAAGAHPTVALVGASGPSELSSDAAEQLERWRARGGREDSDLAAVLARSDVAVDCLLGTGASGAPREPYRAAIEALTAFDGLVVACDVPSGVDAVTGDVPDVAVDAEHTVTLGAHKLGLWLWPARGRCGRLTLADIGVEDGADPPRAHAFEPHDVAALLPPPAPAADKRSLGVVTVLAGFAGMTGAATLTARGALAAGAGLVTLATTARDVVAPTVPEATSIALPDDTDAAFERLAAQAETADALAVGPGVGLAEPTQALVRRVVAELDVPIVLDADGLNAFRHDGDALAAHAAPLLVATPHRRELARLLAADDAEVWPDRARLVPERAAAWDAVLVAKGPGSLVAAPDGRAWVNPTGSAALASGGTGDVLTGIIATLVAQHPEPETVAAAVYLHGLAGEEAAARSHPRSVTALDVAAAVPHALRRIEEEAW